MEKNKWIRLLKKKKLSVALDIARSLNMIRSREDRFSFLLSQLPFQVLVKLHEQLHVNSTVTDNVDEHSTASSSSTAASSSDLQSGASSTGESSSNETSSSRKRKKTNNQLQSLKEFLKKLAETVSGNSILDNSLLSTQNPQYVIKSVIKKIEHTESKMIHYYYLLGKALIKLKKTHKNNSSFFLNIFQEFKISEKTTGHYINLAKFIDAYPKFGKVSVSYSVLRSYIGPIRSWFQSQEAMQLDQTNVLSEGFWKSFQ